MSIKWELAPLSMTEMGIYLDYRKNLEGTAYNLPFIFALPKETDLQRLKDAIKKVLFAHTLMLSRFEMKGSEVVRKVPKGDLSEYPFEIPEYDYDIDRTKIVKPFSDPGGELCRFAIYKGKDGESLCLYMDIHHLLFDGSSIPVFVSELNRAYEGKDLLGEKVTAADFAVAEKNERGTDSFRKSKEYYEKLFSDAEISSSLIHDKEDGEKKNSFLEKTLDIDSGEVSEFVKKSGIRTSTFFTGAYGYLLGRFCGSIEALYGAIHNGRKKEISDTVGMFVKTIPVIERFDKNEVISDHLKGLDKQLYESRKNDLFSYADVCSEFHLQIPTLFAYQGDLFPEMELLGQKIVPENLQSDDPKEEVVAEVFRFNGAYTLRLSYRTDLFEKESLQEFATSYEKTLKEFLAKESFDDIDITSKEQIETLDSFLQALDKPLGPNDIVSMFRDQAKKNPKATALIIGDLKRSYEEIDEVSERIAYYLSSKGIGKGNVVSILIHRNEYMVSASLGVLKSGAGYQPLDPTYPPERLLFMVKDSGAKLVIADEDLTSLIDGYEGEFLLTKDIPGLPPVPSEFEAQPPDEHDLFTLLYTSGSTGVPKGVMLEHGNLANFCRWYVKEYEMSEGTVHAAYASYGFDANMMDLYPALTCGGCVCVVPEDLRLNMQALGRYLGDNNVTIAFMTTQVGRQFAVSPYKPGSLLSLSVGGEKLAKVVPPLGLNFFNVYGPTECTILATKKRVDKEYLRIPIGKAVAGAWLYVVDKNGRRVPPCVPGEFWIAGRGVARGYLNRPEKTREVFTDNPFSKEKGFEKVYHTGDIVRFLPGGEIDFIGRNDGQVKIRGFRIELSEIESVIREYPAISDVTVQAFENESGSGKYVAAYIVVKDGEEVPKGALENFIRQRKPPYMVPSVIMELDRIPLNQNQKVDKKKLPKPGRKAEAEEDNTKHEKTALEQELFDICCNVIGNKEFGVYTPLSDAGLTSITTMQLMVEIEENFGYSPDVNELLSGIRILDIENAIVSNWRNKSGKATETAISENDEEKGALTSAPLSQTQLGIYLECRMDETSDKYNIPFLIKVGADADENRLANAIKKAVDAHPSMKCSIEPGKSGSAMMLMHPELECDVSIEKSDLSDGELEDKISKEPLVFKLSRAPLFRFRIIKNQSSTYLSMIFHHILMDGTSVAVLMEDIEKAYRNEELSPESYNLLQLAEDENKKRSAEALSKAKSVYDKIFAGVSVSSLPAPEKPSKEETGKAGQIECALEGVSAGTVTAFCRDNKLTENVFFTAAFAYMLAKLNGSEEALFASIYNGRTRTETLRIMGMLVKTYPVYVSIDKEKRIPDFIMEVQKLIQDLTSNDLYSFAEVSRDYDVNADILFAYQGDSFTGFTVAGQKAKEVFQPIEDAKAPLGVDIWKKDGRYTIAIEYRKDLFTEAQIKWMCELYSMISAGLTARKCLSEITLLSDKGKEFLDKINDTYAETSFRPVSSMFEECAGKYPDKDAVITPTNKITYKELNESANRIAHTLYDNGAKGRIVSLMLPRSECVYMVRQGILKATGAFLSIAPDYPDDRVRVMVEDSESVILIVNEDILSKRREFLDSFACKVMTVEELLKDERTENLALPAKKDDLAYSIFTSGSTGKPKGVMLTQGNLLNFLDDNSKNPEILGYVEKAKVSLALAAITFDVSIMEEFIPLTHGMTVCMTTEEEIHNPAALSKFMLENGVDMMTCTPSFLSNCIGLSVMKDALKNVRSYDLGAEAFPAALYDKIMAINPDAYIMNGYGPTEATISCTMDQVTDTSLITIGRPASNVYAHVLDEKGNVLPPLIPGELVISGEGVGKGYIGRPDLTKEKFFTFEGKSAYRTGDVVAWTSDGRLRFHGRADNQVKLRGLRIELGEIESAINAVEGVLTSIVVMTGEENNKFLAGYYTVVRDISPDELKMQISKSLTPYMIPGVLMQLDEMPLTQNGKIDKKKLPKVEFVPDKADFVEPEDDVERDFCDWFAQVLNMEKVSAEGNFFELGGTSLSASVIAMNASDKGYNIVYADVFKAQTPRKLAAIAKKEEVDEIAADNPDIRSFDYDKLPLLANCEDRLKEITKGDIGNLLLTGATGFLGIHVLHEYISYYAGNVYCLLRGDAPDERLKQLYFYYFDKALDPYFENGRISIISGDISDEKSLEKAGDYPFDTLINCAALVKHFVNDDSLERINVQGVKNLIALCKIKGKRLIQTSTVSVAGEGIDGTPPRDWKIRENVLYKGQILDNAYALSKFRAEKAVLEAAADGLDAKIMRLGNLMGRHLDGEFQVNFRSNAFIRTLASYKSIGAMPYSIMNASTDFSEIDMTARAILLLAGTPKEFTVFHPVNNHVVTYADIVYSMREYGFTIDSVEEEEFARRMKEAGDASSALTAYNNREGGEKRYMLDQNCDFTANALYRLGFKWPVSGEKYIVKMIKALDELIMFEE